LKVVGLKLQQPGLLSLSSNTKTVIRHSLTVNRHPSNVIRQQNPIYHKPSTIHQKQARSILHSVTCFGLRAEE